MSDRENLEIAISHIKVLISITSPDDCITQEAKQFIEEVSNDNHGGEAG